MKHIRQFIHVSGWLLVDAIVYPFQPVTWKVFRNRRALERAFKRFDKRAK